MTDPEARYDVLMIPKNLGQAVTEESVKSLLRFMIATRMVDEDEAALTDTWNEVYLRPSDSAHELFAKGEYRGPLPVFHEAVLRFGSDLVEIPYGLPGSEVRCFLEFRGAIRPEPSAKFRERVRELLFFRPRVFHRAHTDLPPHREVPKDQQRDPTRTGKIKLGERGPALVGTRVEEW